MTDRASADSPIAIDRVDRARGDGDPIRFRLSGRWLGPGRADEHEPLLVIQLHGRRHRFPASRDAAPGAALASGAWEATFSVPSWAEPSQDGQATLWVGDSVVRVPLAGSGTVTAPPAEAARLRGALANAESELEAQTAMQSALESAHGDLRGELQALMSAVTVQRQDFDRRCRDVEDRLAPAESERDALREQLAAAQVSREAAAGEVAGLRAELDRLGSELAVSREQMSAHGGDLGEAQRLLTDARALTEQLRGQNPQ